MSGQQHPDTETLASLRAGLVGGFRGRRLAAHVARCAHCAATGEELAAVGSFLASMPSPALPQTFEQRISAALAAEASARTITASENAQSAPQTGPAAPSPADRRQPAPRPRRPARRLRPAMALAPVAAVLLAGFGYLLSGIGGSAGPPSSEAIASGSARASSAASASATGPLPVNAPMAGSRPGTAHEAPTFDQPDGFLVATSGTNYLPGSLGAQVRGEMDLQYSGNSPRSQSPSDSAAPSGGAVSASASSTQIPPGYAVPSRTLVDCVLHLTRNVRPKLVDSATYQGKPTYVIAVDDRVWVVGRGCTASHPALIATLALTGTP